ncbi:MAG: hypothetical protein AAF799_36850 [Myxococcota bacterium]
MAGRWAIQLGLAACAATACTPPASVRELHLTVDASAVEPRLGELGVLSVEVYGVQQTTELCTLARRCLYPLDLGSPQTSDDLQDALRQVEPLVEVDHDAAHQVAVIGRSGGLCDAHGPFLVCGFADIGTTSTADLTVALTDNECPTTLPEFCPEP